MPQRITYVCRLLAASVRKRLFSYNVSSHPAMKNSKNPGLRRISFHYPVEKAQMLDKLQAKYLLEKGEKISKETLAMRIFDQALNAAMLREGLQADAYLIAS